MSCKTPVKSSPATNQHPTVWLSFLLPNQQCYSTDRKECQIPRTCSLQAHVGSFNLVLDHYMLLVALAQGYQASHWPFDASKQLTAENISSETANIPVLGLSSCEHSVLSLLSASDFISTELTPMYTQDTTLFHSNSSYVRLDTVTVREAKTKQTRKQIRNTVTPCLSNAPASDSSQFFLRVSIRQGTTVRFGQDGVVRYKLICCSV